MKILVGKLKDLWPELTVPMSIPKKIDESKEKLIGNLKPHRSIDNNGATIIFAGNPEEGNRQQSTSNNNEESRKDSEVEGDDEDEEGIVC